MRSKFNNQRAIAAAAGANELNMMARRQFNLSVAVAILVMLAVAAFAVVSAHPARVASTAPHKFVMIVAPAPTTAISANESVSRSRS